MAEAADGPRKEKEEEEVVLRSIPPPRLVGHSCFLFSPPAPAASLCAVIDCHDKLNGIDASPPPIAARKERITVVPVCMYSPFLVGIDRRPSQQAILCVCVRLTKSSWRGGLEKGR